MSVWGRGCVHARAWASIHVRKSEDSLGCWSPSSTLLEAGAFLEFFGLFPSSQPPISLQECQVTAPKSGSYVGSGELYSGLHAYTASNTRRATSWIQLEYFHELNQFSSFLMSHAMVPPSRESLEALKPSLVAWHSFSTGLRLLMIKNFPELSYVNSLSVRMIVKAKPLLRRVPSQFSSYQIVRLCHLSREWQCGVRWAIGFCTSSGFPWAIHPC